MQRIVYFLFLIGVTTFHAFAELHFSVTAASIDENKAKLIIPFSYGSSETGISSASLSVQLEIQNTADLSLVNSLSSTQFVTTSESAYGTLSTIIHQPHLWSTELPNTYKATLTFLRDNIPLEKIETVFGIRIINSEKEEWQINHIPLHIKGIDYDIHNNRWREDISLLKDLHVNTIRIQESYPPDELLEYCNTTGMYVICPPHENMTAKPQIPSHPCIIAWELSSPHAAKTQPDSLRFLDPSRPIIAVDHQYDVMESFADSFTDVFANNKITSHAAQIRNVFSPIQIEPDEIQVQSGENGIHLNIKNGYQHINLNQTTCRWVLFQNQTAIQHGTLHLNIPPQQSFEMEIQCTLPQTVTQHFYFLTLEFRSDQDKMIDRHTVRLRPRNWQKELVLRLEDLKQDKEWTADTSAQETQYQHQQFIFRDRTPKAGWFLMTQQGNVRLITDGPFIVYDEHINPAAHTITRDLWINKRSVDRMRKSITVKSALHEIHQDNPAALDIVTLYSPFGYIDIRYELHPSTRTSNSGVLGLGFQLPSTLQNMYYTGKGPYPSYPGKRALNHFGIFSFLKGQDFIPGNREKVTLAAFTGSHGYGLGILMFDGNISILPNEEGTLLSINAAVAGMGNDKTKMPFPIDVTHPPKSGYAAAFRLIPLYKSEYPELFKNTFYQK